MQWGTALLTIRKQQIHVLAASRRVTFETRLEHHLQKFFPDQVAAAGPDDVAEFIRDGQARALAHGFKAEREICKYLDLMCIFGREFDSNPRLPWAAKILGQPFLTPRAKMNRLVETALLHAEAGESAHRS